MVNKFSKMSKEKVRLVHKLIEKSNYKCSESVSHAANFMKEKIQV